MLIGIRGGYSQADVDIGDVVTILIDGDIDDDGLFLTPNYSNEDGASTACCKLEVIVTDVKAIHNHIFRPHTCYILSVIIYDADETARTTFRFLESMPFHWSILSYGISKLVAQHCVERVNK